MLQHKRSEGILQNKSQERWGVEDYSAVNFNALMLIRGNGNPSSEMSDGIFLLTDAAWKWVWNVCSFLFIAHICFSDQKCGCTVSYCLFLLLLFCWFWLEINQISMWRHLVSGVTGWNCWYLLFIQKANGNACGYQNSTRQKQNRTDLHCPTQYPPHNSKGHVKTVYFGCLNLVRTSPHIPADSVMLAFFLDLCDVTE